METIKIKIIIGSIREGRFGDKPSQWICEQAQKKEGWDVELLDLRDYELPMFREPVSPIRVFGSYGKPDVDRWAQKIAEADGYIIVTPEYNHSFSSALKNNIDYLYNEWVGKSVAFVGYGMSGGAAAIQELRSVATELQMAPIRNEVYIPGQKRLLAEDGTLRPGAFEPYEKSAQNLIDQLDWWARALRTARLNGLK